MTVTSVTIQLFLTLFM